MQADKKQPQWDAIVFDVGNVLLSFDTIGYLRTRYPEALAKRLNDAIFASPHWIEVDRSVLHLEEVAARIVRDAPDIAELARETMDNSLDIIQPMPETIAYLPRLKAAGYKLYVLSNYGAEYFAQTCARYSIFGEFDGFIVSGREKVLKPDAHIYHALLDRFGLNPARTLFIDDREENIRGAAALGIDGMLFTHASQLDALFA